MPDNPTPVAISDLPVASTPTANDILAGEQSGTTSQFAFSAILAWFEQQLTPADIDAVPTSRTINGNALTGDIVLDAEDVGAASVDDLDNVAAAIPAASDADPAMDGTASPGVSGSWARGDHVHPSDTSKADLTNLAPVEASSTASTNYAVGSHLVYAGVLYEVTAAISSGETIIPGTNVEAVTVTDITDALDTRTTALEDALDGLVARLGAI